MVKLYKSIFLIFTVNVFITSCGGYTPGKMKCTMAPDPYKEIYNICLKNIDKKSPKMVKTCDETAYQRTKFCY